MGALLRGSSWPSSSVITVPSGKNVSASGIDCASVGAMNVLKSSFSGVSVRLDSESGGLRGKIGRRVQLVRCLSDGTGGKSGGFDADKILKGVTQTFWGRGLPPGMLVQVAREGWTATWRTMMSQLAPSSASGSYQRPVSAFRSRIVPGGTFSPEKGRYHLYAALSCPWAHRTLIVHSLKGLATAVALSVAVPGPSGLWVFDPSKQAKGATPGGARAADTSRPSIRPTADLAGGRQSVKEVYASRKGGYDGRSTVPMLWDSKSREVVNNESAEIIEILNSSFNDFAEQPHLDLAPPELRPQMDKWNDEIYNNVNNGVYRCGFSTSQSAYDSAVHSLFQSLDGIERHLAVNRYLCGDRLTLSDVRLFTTLYRFDAAYYILFKCSQQKIAEYDNLSRYVREIYQIPEVAATCDMDAIMAGYFGTLFPLNPGGIIPVCPRSADMAASSRPGSSPEVELVL